MSNKILIAEDDAIVAHDLRTILERNGYTVTAIASDGRAAIQSCNQDRPDLILMDILLKGDLNGVETAILIQSTGASIPIVFLTAFSQSEFPGTKNNVTFSFLNKPFAEDDLIQCIQAAMNGRQC